MNFLSTLRTLYFFLFICMLCSQYTDSHYKSLQLRIWEMFSFGWHLIEKNLIPLLIISTIIAIPSNIIKSLIPTWGTASDVIASTWIHQLSLVILTVIGYMAGLYIIRGSLRWEMVSIREAFLRTLEKWWVFIATSILSTLATLWGLILFIIPGIIISVYFMFAGYAVIFEEKKYLEALYYSRSLIKGRWWQTLWKSLGFGIVSFLLLILPVLLITYSLGDLVDAWETPVWSLIRDTLLDIALMPSMYVGVWLFLGFQKHPHTTENTI